MKRARQILYSILGLLILLLGAACLMTYREACRLEVGQMLISLTAME